MVWSFGAGQQEEILIVFLKMTTCNTTATTMNTIYDTHGVVCALGRTVHSGKSNIWY